MKIHYINILLFAFPLNILVTLCHAHNNNKPYITSCHTPKIPITRLLCECELYAPVNYDNDPEMKKIMQQFMDRTTNRLREYDDRMVEKRNHCKDKCDKEIQKIILKDKLEKQMAEQLTTLDTNIITDDIPTCICEKSLEDKVEKGCLKCGGILGTAVPEFGAIGVTALYTLNQWSITATAAAKTAALTEATKAATQADMREVIIKIQEILDMWGSEALDLTKIVNKTNFNCASSLIKTAEKLFDKACINVRGNTSPFCNSTIYHGGESTFNPIAKAGAESYTTTLTTKTPVLEARNIAAVEATTSTYYTAIIASIIAILIIVLIMVIIYLILRYRRKKKMKKKLQYIKLLEE